MRYGQYTSAVAQQLSIEHLGTIVFSGKTKEIWIDGKCIAANFQGSVDDIRATIGQLSELQTTEKGTIVAAINELSERIDNILGGEDLERTLDTIKEIQEELLRDVRYTVVYTEDSEDSEGETIEVTRVVDEETGTVTYVDSMDNVVATETEGGIEYEEGYDNLVRQNVIETLMDSITDNKERIETLEAKTIVSGVDVDENISNNFVSASDETNPDDTKQYTIGVQYGTFKTGHGNVMDSGSNGYTDGIATVKGVQDYVEERISWDEFVSSAESLVDEINDGDSEYSVSNDMELDDQIVIQG